MKTRIAGNDSTGFFVKKVYRPCVARGAIGNASLCGCVFYTGGIADAERLAKLMASCRASFTLLNGPLTLAELAVHLATRKNFVIHPCRERSLRALQIVAGPYGYDVLFDADRELVALQYRHGPQLRLCEVVATPATTTRARR